MIGRMLGAARLSSDTYEEVERDRGATLQALAIVISGYYCQSGW